MQNVFVTICQIVKQIFCLSSGPFYVHSLWTYATRALPTQTLEGIRFQALFLPTCAQKKWGEWYILSLNGVEATCELWPALLVHDFTGTCKVLLILILVLFDNMKISGRNGSQSPYLYVCNQMSMRLSPNFLGGSPDATCEKWATAQVIAQSKLTCCTEKTNRTVLKDFSSATCTVIGNTDRSQVPEFFEPVTRQSVVDTDLNHQLASLISTTSALRKDGILL